MKVYVVEVGAYEEAYITGVYASLEAAMAAHPAAYQWLAHSEGRWHDAELRNMTGGQYWHTEASIDEHEVAE